MAIWHREIVRKFLAIVFLLLPLLWLTWAWKPLPPDGDSSRVRVDGLTPQVPPAERAALGAFTLQGLWRLQSDNQRFGGYSALVALPSGHFLAVSDRSGWLGFGPQLGAGAHVMPTGRTLVRRLRKGPNESFDVESVVRDPVDGSLWTGLESEWHVARIDPETGLAGFHAVPPLVDWPENGGAEAMARLADGRWIMLCESCGGGRGGLHLGLLFAGRPGLSPSQKFGILTPAGFDPVDMAPLPDGRLLILTRGFKLFPPRFTSRIVLADIATIDPKRPLATQELARIEGPALRENYEGMTIRAEADGRVGVWLISDANDTAFQETRVMQLRLDLTRLPPKN